MPIVLDCSTTMAWCFADETDRYADKVLGSMGSNDALVPSIWTLEVANVLLNAERRGRLNEADSARFLDLLGNLPIHVDERDAAVAFTSVLSCGHRLGLTSYDAAYLDLAMRTGAPLATRDKALRKACRAAGAKLFA